MTSSVTAPRRRPRPRRRRRVRPRRPVAGPRRGPRRRTGSRLYDVGSAPRRRAGAQRRPASRCCPSTGRRSSTTADTVIVPGIHRPARDGPRATARRPCRPRWPAIRPAPGWCRSAPAPSCWPPPGCSTAARPPPTGPAPTSSARCSRRSTSTRTCSSSTTATCSPRPASPPAIDLCLHLVRRDFGSEVANRAARRCVVPPWRDGGQAQFIERPRARPRRTPSTAPARAWALERLDEPLDLPALAGQAPDERARRSPAGSARRPG